MDAQAAANPLTAMALEQRWSAAIVDRCGGWSNFPANADTDRNVRVRMWIAERGCCIPRQP
jgi:hypothetical protein